MFKKLLAFISFCVFFFSCSIVESEHLVYVEENSVDLNEPVFYHQPSGLYLKHQNDPFSLSNMQAAYDKVVATKGEGGFFQQGGKLSPTHYALTIYPRTVKEWTEIDNMEDIKVSYHPFDYAPVPGKSAGDYSPNTFFEQSKYTEICTYKTIEGDAEKEETVSLPILYVVWPADKVLPEGYDYTVDYGVFIPSSSPETKSKAALSLQEKRILEKEALVLALGEKALLKTKSFDEQGDSANFKVLTGSVSCFDNTYSGQLPLPNIGMKFELGTFINDTHSNDIGTFDITIDTQYHPYLNFSFFFRTSKFEVRLANSSSYYQLSLGTVASVFGPDLYGHRDFDLSYLSTQALHAFRAANYYYRGSHEITKYDPGTRIVIRAFNQLDPVALGRFYYNSNSCHIEIYKDEEDSSSQYIGTTLHELGHYLHYGLVGYSNFDSTQLLVSESFSSFVGWSLGHKYYQQYNYYLTSGLDEGTGQGRQRWTGPSDEYSPVFVDLQDSYNQGYYGLGYVYDTISGVPYSAIQTIITNCYTWTSVRQALAALVNTYYTQSQFDAFVLFYGN